MPTIITRQQAITQRLSSYFTGKPCKRGHISRRYTVNSGCEMCIHPTFSSITSDVYQEKREQREQVQVDRQARAAARSRMVRAKFRVNDCDLDTFRLSVLGVSLLREPALREQDISTKWAPRSMNPTKRIYAFNIFLQDEQQLRELELALEHEHDAPIYLITPQLCLSDEIERDWPAESTK